MAIIDVVKYEHQDGVIVYKFPSCDLRWGTQLVVFPGQEAFFMKGGVVCDRFTEGTYTLKTNNIPLLNKIINLIRSREPGAIQGSHYFWALPQDSKTC